MCDSYEYQHPRCDTSCKAKSGGISYGTGVAIGLVRGIVAFALLLAGAIYGCKQSSYNKNGKMTSAMNPTRLVTGVPPSLGVYQP